MKMILYKLSLSIANLADSEKNNIAKEYNPNKYLPKWYLTKRYSKTRRPNNSDKLNLLKIFNEFRQVSRKATVPKKNKGLKTLIFLI